MKSVVVVWLLVAIGAAALGCRNDKAKADKSERDEESAEPKASKMPAALASWLPKEAKKLWLGAWSSRLTLASNKKGYTSMAGDPVALEIDEKKATAFGGGEDQELGFDLESPCAARFSEEMKGGKSHQRVLFVVEKGDIVIGLGAAGYRKGKRAVVCSEDGGVHVVDESGTTTWTKRFNDWEEKPSSSAWSVVDGKDVLTLGKGTIVVSAEGDVLASENFRQFVKEGYHQRTKTFAEAKALVTAKIKENDPSERAKKAGGIVGKTDTVLSLIATYGTDKSLKGKSLEVGGLYLNSNRFESRGETTHNVILVESADATRITLTCDLGKTPIPEGLTQYEKVIAKGIVGESFGQPDLRDCTILRKR